MTDTTYDHLVPERPHTLQIEITSHCNLKCKMCPLTTQGTSSGMTPGHIAPDLWERLVPAAQQAGKVVITGFGEPLMHPHCLRLLRELNDRGIQLSLTTNGVALGPELAAQLTGLAQLRHINISLDTTDPQIYRTIRNGAVEKALRGIQALMNALDDPERVTVSSVLMNSNIESLTAMPETLRQLGVTQYVLQEMVDYSGDVDAENPLHHARLSKHLAAIKSACKQAGVTLLFTLPARLDLETRNPDEALRRYYHPPAADGEDVTRQCCLPWEIPFIDKDGLVFPCCYAVTEQQAVLGDLKTESLDAVWHGERYQAFRRVLLSGKPIPAVCRNCHVAPLGEHPLLYSAEICAEHSILENQVTMRLVLRNTGARAWTRDDLVRIGSIEPIDRLSSYVHPTWMGANRIGTFRERTVPPGGLATFTFRINPTGDVPAEPFQVVFEGVRWLPGTRFEIRPGPAREHPLVLAAYTAWNRVSELIGL